MRTALFAVVMGFVVAACPAFAQDVTFGVCLSLTGEFQESGKKALAGIKLRVDDYNVNRTPDQPKLSYVVRDDHSKPDFARENAQTFADMNLPAIIGPLSTMLVMGMRDVAEKEGIVIISPSVTSTKVGKNRDWVCRLLFDDEFQGTALARYLAGKERITRAAAIINTRLGYATSVFSAFKKEFEALGGSIVADERYEWVASEERPYDFGDILERIEAAKPQIVLLPVYSVEVATIISQSTRYGYSLRFCGGDTWVHELVRVASGNAVEGAVYVSGIDLESESPEMTHYYDLYNNSNDPALQASSVMGYDAASLLIEAMKNGSDAATVRDTLYSIKDFRIATGTITVDPERGSEKSAFVHRIEQGPDGFVARVIDEIKP